MAKRLETEDGWIEVEEAEDGGDWVALTNEVGQHFTVRPADVPALCTALHRVAGFRKERVLIVLDASDYVEVIDKHPGWRDMFQDADLVVGVANTARPVVLKSRLPDQVEVGVLR